MKIVINSSFGGFGLTDKELLAYASKKGIALYEKESEFSDGKDFYTSPNFEDESFFSHFDMERTDPCLIEVVEEINYPTSLKVVEIPDGIDYSIEDYSGGKESIHEVHRSWS